MKKTIFLLYISLFLIACSSSKNTLVSKYFDQNNTEISESKFKEILLTRKVLEIPGDSTHHKKLIDREKRGKVSSREQLELLLKKETKINIDKTKPIVIIFYPGKDKCNAMDSSDATFIKNKYLKLEDGIFQLINAKPIYLYKSNEGLELLVNTMKWHKDPNQTIENLFFRHPFPCSSFVVISKEGDYISYFGEYPVEYVWEATQIMLN